MNLFYILADAADASGSTGGGWTMIIMMVALIAAMYFFMIRPQRKQEKETNEMRNNLQVGDEITTIGGIIGKIVSIKDETCMIETGRDRTKIRILKSAVRNVDVPAAVANGIINPEAPKAEEKTESAETAEKTEEKPAKKGFFKKEKKK